MSGALLKEYQEVIDAADPFLVEAHADKSSDELFEFLYQLEHRADRIRQMGEGNRELLKGLEDSIVLIRTMYQKKLLLDADNRDGISLA